jgi:hypothetical protein
MSTVSVPTFNPLYEDIMWICTDPNLHQYGRRVGKGLYEFREFDRYSSNSNPDNLKREDFIHKAWSNSEYWVHITITMAHYTHADIFNHLSSYYDKPAILNMIRSDRDDDEWVMAECIFEQESGLY